MSRTALLTGGTGLVGVYLLRELIRNDTFDRVVALSRDKGGTCAGKRIFSELSKITTPEELKRADKIVTLPGDISQDSLGMEKHCYQDVASGITDIFHCAADTAFNRSIEEIRRINVEGTLNMLEFAGNCRDLNGFYHMSTIVVAGDRRGIAYEDDLDVGQAFRNTYEQSKFEAEKAVSAACSAGLPTNIFRIGIVTGDSLTGYTNNFKMLYQPLHLASLGLFKILPVDPESTPSVCQVDSTAAAILSIVMSDMNVSGKTYHIVKPDPVRLVDLLFAASEYFGFKMPQCVSAADFDFLSITPLQNKLLEAHLPYFNYYLRFDTRNADAVFERTGFKWPPIDKPYLYRLFEFCEKNAFIKKRKR